MRAMTMITSKYRTFFFLNAENLKEFHMEIMQGKSEHESNYLNSLLSSKWKKVYEDFLLDVNWLRYEENTNMQTINKIVPLTHKTLSSCKHYQRIQRK
ncbi:hypothetical protein BLA29_001920 [Euroglyphus maynei]|uniref:Uncharacterized protein n=1 Tax=Euroglyphus maynei TaxID=6958 RepID=A0A1Y3B2N0_EURMA|nr:hypothetical protein BLA29_001920 [Euroglyphus maynei]